MGIYQETSYKISRLGIYFSNHCHRSFACSRVNPPVLYCTVLYLSTCYKFWLHFHDACMVVLSAGRLVYELLNSKYLTWSAFNNPMVAGGWASHHISKFDFQWMHPNTCLDSVRLRFHSLLTKDVPYARGEQHFYQ